MNSYIISTRATKSGKFIEEPDKTLFLKVPDSDNDILPTHQIKVANWVSDVMGLADGDQNPFSISEKGDVLIFIHGFNNSTETVLQRHRLIEKNLRQAEWKGVVISFDWPSDNSVLNYYEDREDAAAVAYLLVQDCIKLLTKYSDKCKINVHIIAHSTGAFVVREAFSRHRDFGDLYKNQWRIGEVVFIAADIEASDLEYRSTNSIPMFNRIKRLTNYLNGYDAVLATSNAKRLGTSPRAGRSYPEEKLHQKAVVVDCTDFFTTLTPEKLPEFELVFAHSWYFNDKTFFLDLAMTLEGAIDRNVIPTREKRDNRLYLKKGKRPKFLAQYGIKEAVKGS